MRKISIIMATHNPHPEYLQQAINSVLQQSFADFKFIIVDDCSQKSVEEVLAGWYQDERIVCIRNNHNLGLTKSLNEGLKFAESEYIARIDDDDLWSDPDKLKKQVEFMDAHPDYVLCGCNVLPIDEKGVQQGAIIHTREKDPDIRKVLLQSNQFAHSSIVMRTSALQQVGGRYNSDYKVSQDYELWCRLGRVGKLYNLQNTVISYRVHTRSITNKNKFNQKKMTFKTCLKNKDAYPNFFRALFFRSCDFILPESIKNTILTLLKKFTHFGK